MNGFDQKQIDAARERKRLGDAQEGLYRSRNRLHNMRQSAETARRAGAPRLREILGEIDRLELEVSGSEAVLDTARGRLGDLLADFPGLDQPQTAVENLADSTPFLLLPVRIETRFMSAGRRKQLWVRIFPDDVAVHTHEKGLTADEVEAGRAYWLAVQRAASIGDDSEREAREQGAWRDLADAFDGSRAAWVARETRPESLNVSEEEELAFPEFDPETLKPDAWSRAPRTYVMPDRFVVIGYSGGKKVAEKTGNLVRDPLVLGPEPSREGPDLAQVDGELEVSPDLEWIYDFDKAVAGGMGIVLDLERPFDRRGFDRLLVLGLRLSANADESRRLLEELIDNHHYAADGMAVLPQGTSTNNTDSEGSGFSSVDPGERESFATESGEPNLPPDESPKRDGHRLAEALGIDTAPLAYLAGTGQTDVTEAHVLNKALWPATLGYYLEEMLELDQGAVHRTRTFFTDYVTGRGPLPAVRVGAQPYGVLLTSDLPRWKWGREAEGSSFTFLEELQDVLGKVQASWSSLAGKVPHVDAEGDKYKNLLRTLGLHATSVEYLRRHAVGKEFLWNYLSFNIFSAILQRMRATMSRAAERIVEDLGLTKLREPDGRLLNKIFDLAFFFGHDDITDPLVDDVDSRDDEKWSETEGLPARYRVPAPGSGGFELRDYIGWLIGSDIDDMKRHLFRDQAGEKVSAPKAVLYRMLHRALLLAYHDASLNLYVARELVTADARREIELANITEDRTVTRWEFLEADVKEVAPDLADQSMSMVRFLQTPAGLQLPESQHLREVRECLVELEGLPTARLERLFAEHLDLCTYRLDAWQCGFFTRRLESMRGSGETRRKGVYLGSFGWLETVRPGPEPVPVNPEEVPKALRDGTIVEQDGNGGFIHGPSINHAVAAAVLRNAYLTHADENNAETMSINLSSGRVRTALSFLEGIRNGQELGSLLGYQFERGLHDRHGDPSLNQFIPAFRNQYPLVADKITPDEDGEQIETKEARNVFDGYALLEKAFLKEPPLEYPYGVDGLPASGAQVAAIKAEVKHMAASFDAVADLATAEGVYQVTQGNYDRAGAMLKAFTQGNNPPEAEIARTPRSGVTISNRVTLHVEPDSSGATAWPGAATPRSSMEPGLNAWLAGILGPSAKLRYLVTHEGVTDESQSLQDLGLQPIDLVLLVGDNLQDGSTELEMRIEDAFRVDTGATKEISIGFMIRGATWAADDMTIFEVLPLLRGLRALVTGCRPLSALDYQVEDEADADTESNPNPDGYDEPGMRARVEARIVELDTARADLSAAMATTVDESGDEPVAAAGATDPALIVLRDALRAISLHGIPDSLPGLGTSDEEKDLLAQQAVNVRAAAVAAVAAATALKDFVDLDLSTLTTAGKIEAYREAARQVLGASFNTLPDVTLSNASELSQAVAFRDSGGLARHHANPFLVEEWLQGNARVREKMDGWERVRGLAEALHDRTLAIVPLQLPFRETDHWIAVEYPESFAPEGQYLSVVQHPSGSGFDPLTTQRGLVIDDWTEVIPNRSETTGLAVHYNQPNSEPPQTLLLAVPPEVTGSWTWDELLGILNDTLDRAKVRAVEPDLFGPTGWGHLLPAVLTAVSSYPWATISTDVVSTTATYSLAKFDEEA